MTAEGILACGNCGRDTVTGWCDATCRRLASNEAAGRLALGEDVTPTRTFRLVGRGGVTWPERDTTPTEAITWWRRIRGAYAGLQPALQTMAPDGRWCDVRAEGIDAI